MDFYFVYSSGGGAGDWNGIDRTFLNHMPAYFKNHLLLKFGDIFFNHRSSGNIIKPEAWKSIRNARAWVTSNTKDQTVMETPDMIMDVGTSKLVSYITSFDTLIFEDDVISRFDEKLKEEKILEKYCEVIKTSHINNAVTFDIPNLFKVRTQAGNTTRCVFSERQSHRLMEACAKYSNQIHSGLSDMGNCILTFVNVNWSDAELCDYLKNLDYCPNKLAVGGLTNYDIKELPGRLKEMNKILHFDSYERVHYLGAGGLKKVRAIIEALGDCDTFSADNTTPYNRVIDGSTSGAHQSGYYDYESRKLFRVTPDTINDILELHKRSASVAYFSLDEMKEILSGILQHQSHNSSQYTYECRAKLIIHNNDVYRYNINNSCIMK